MQYQSIIRLFEYCNVDYNTMDTGKIKKILTAEFSIAEGGIISIDGFDYTKNDIFQELERTDFSQRLKYHQLIWKNESLLACLETNTVDFRVVSTWFPLKEDSFFVRFISPYFAESFDKIMRKFLNPVDFSEATRWLNFLFLIDNAADEDKALSGIRLFIMEFIHSLKNVNSTTYVTIMPELETWTDQSASSFINSLPDSLYMQIEDMVKAVINFTVLIQNENTNLCYELSYELVRINKISSNLQELIAENHEIYKKRTEHAPAERRSVNLSFFWVIFVIVLFCFRIASYIPHSSRSSHSTYTGNSSFPKPKDVANEYYTNLRNEYAVVDAIKFDGEQLNPDKIISPYAPYYMLFESNSTDSIVVHVVNNGSETITLYLKSADGIILDLSLLPSEKIKIGRNRNTMDLLLCNYITIGSSRQIIPILISDSLNLMTHNFNLDGSGGVINIDLSDGYQKGDFIMEIYSKPNEHGILKNYLTFPGSQWTD